MIYRSVLLPLRCKDSELAEQWVHSERPTLIRYDWYDPLTDVRLHQVAKQPDERHGGRDFLSRWGALVEGGVGFLTGKI